MKLKKLIKEHKPLIKVLKIGSKTQQFKEAHKQEKELKNYLRRIAKGEIEE